jgi:hypothetical protein
MEAARSGSQEEQGQEGRIVSEQHAEVQGTACTHMTVGQSIQRMKDFDVTPTQQRGPLLIQPETPQPVPFKLGAATSASLDFGSMSYPVPYGNASRIWPTPVLNPINVRRHLNLNSRVEPPQASVVESVGTSGSDDKDRGAAPTNVESSWTSGASPPDLSVVEGLRGETSEASTPSLCSSPLPASDSTSDFERLLLQVSSGPQVCTVVHRHPEIVM